MKKLILPLVALLAIAGVVLAILFRHHVPRGIRAADLVPASTIAWLEIPDAPRTLERFRHTALFALWQEPEVQAFLQQPREKSAELKGLSTRLQQLKEVAPRDFFVALLSVEDNHPRFVLGLAIDGERKALDTLLGDARADLKKAHPAARIDLQSYGPAEIQTFTDGDFTLAEAVRSEWYFLASSLDDLKATLDRYEGQGARHPAALSADPLFQKCAGHLPQDPEASFFLRTQALTGRLLALLNTSGQPLPPEQEAELKKQQALAATTRIEGEDFQDSVFLLAPGAAGLGGLKPGARAPASSSADTLFFYTAPLPPHAADQALRSPALALVPGVSAFDGLLRQHGSSLAAFVSSLGPDLALLLNWPAAGQPAPVMIAEARPETHVRETLESALASAPGWTRAETPDAVLWSTTVQAGMLPLEVTLGLSGDSLLVGPGQAALAGTAHQVAAHGPDLSTQADFQGATRNLPAGATLVAWMNTRQVVQRTWMLARPVLAMSLAFNPATTSWLDASRLPSADALSRHLGSTTLTATDSADGRLSVSRGPVTFTQLGALTGAGVGFAAAQVMGQGNLPGVGFPGLGNMPAPPVAPPIRTPATPTPEPAATPVPAATPEPR